MNLVGLVLTFIAGLFFAVGFIIAAKSKNKEKLSYFAISLAFIVMLNLIMFDLVPEVLEIFANNKFWGLFLVLTGIAILKVLDLFIPNHHHDHDDDEENHHEHNSHVYHIGIVTLLSLLLHNIIEGIAIYGLTINSIEAGIFMCVGVALHNIPFGIEISLLLDKLQQRKLSNKILMCTLIFSSLFGGLIGFTFGNISELFLGIITAITLGMIIYISLLELLPEMLNNHKHKEVYYGIIVGVIVILLSLVL